LLIGNPFFIRPPPLTTKYTDWDRFQDELNNTINLLIRITSASELDAAINNFAAALVAAAQHATPPLLTPTPSTEAYPLQIRVMIRKHHTACKKWQCTRLPEDRATFNRLKRICNPYLESGFERCDWPI